MGRSVIQGSQMQLAVLSSLLLSRSVDYPGISQPSRQVCQKPLVRALHIPRGLLISMWGISKGLKAGSSSDDKNNVYSRHIGPNLWNNTRTNNTWCKSSRLPSASY